MKKNPKKEVPKVRKTTKKTVTIPELPNKPDFAFRDGAYVIFVSRNENRVEMALWDKMSEFPTDIYQYSIYPLPN